MYLLYVFSVSFLLLFLLLLLLFLFFFFFMEQAECSETSAYKIRRRGITQKKTYNIQNTAKV